MKHITIIGIVLLCLCQLQEGNLNAQNNRDCSNAVIICSDSLFAFNPNGAGFDDFANPNNDNGCLVSFEVQSAWYYFEFRDDMPPNSVIGFALQPTGSDVFPEDFDFAIYGPNLSCDSLGSPVRCSFANTFSSGQTLPTGLGNGALDASEDAQGDGWLEPMTVQPGDGFYLLLDNFLGNSNGFQFTWSGSAKPFLNCFSNPNCDIAITAPNDTTICSQATDLVLNTSITAAGSPVYTWSSPSGHLNLLDNPNVANPTLTIPDDLTGTLSFQVIATEGECSATDIVQVEVLAEPEAEIEGDIIFCLGQNSTLSLSQTFDTYFWSTGDQTPTIQINQPGDYRVTFVDSNGCTGEASITTTTFPELSPVPFRDTTICNGETIELTALPNFSNISWSTSETTTTIEVSEAREYILSAIDANGCAVEDTITVSHLPNPFPEISGDSVICQGNVVTLTAEAGFSSYLWSDNSTGLTYTTSTPELVRLTVVDQNGCTGTREIQVSEFSEALPIITGGTGFCLGESLTLDAGGGYDVYTWSNQADTQTIEVTTAGIYSVTVTNAQGCSGDTTIVIEEFESPVVELLGDTLFCENETTTISTTNLFATYQWSTGDNTSEIEVSQADTIQLLVIDGNGCTGEAEIQIQERPNPNPQFLEPALFCEGDTITVELTEAFDLYSWSSGSNEASIDIFESGTIQITVTDEEGCSGQASLDVIANPLPTVNIMGPAALCTGSSLDLEATAGYPSYEWSTDEDASIININAGGIYIVTVTDDNGCVNEASLTVSESAPPVIELEEEASFCDGDSLVLDPGDFELYGWSNGSNMPTITIYQGGVYDVEVSNTAGCISSASINVTVNEVPEPEIITSGSLCPESSITLSTNQPYNSYEWSANATEETLEINDGGLYTLTVTNSFGCIGTASLSVEQVNVPDLSIQGPDALCPGQEAELQASLGFVSYQWSNGDNTATIQVDSGGIYALTAIGEFGCEVSTETEIEALELPNFILLGDSTICEGERTEFEISGTNISSFQWETFPMNQDLDVEVPGDYTIVVNSSDGCLVERAVPITVNPLPSADAGVDAALNCITTSIELGGENTSLGNAYSYSWGRLGDNEELEPVAYPTITEPGTYEFYVENIITGCRSNADSVIITSDLEVPSISVPNPDTLNCATALVQINASATNQNNSITFQWMNSEGETISNGTEPRLTVDEPGEYDLFALNTINGCIADTTIVVVEDTIWPRSIIQLDAKLDCRNEIITLDGSQSDSGPTIIYEWITGEGNIIAGNGTRTPRINEPGRYYLFVREMESSCFNIDSVDVIEDREPPVVTIEGELILDCITSEASLMGNVNANGAAVDYTWRFDRDPDIIASRANLTALEPGEYILEAVNLDNGCIGEESVIVVEDPNVPQEIEFDITRPACSGREDGGIIINAVSGGEGPYLYRLNDRPFSPDQTFNDLAPGNYELTVQDARGCEYETDILIPVGAEVWADLGPDREIKLGESVNLSPNTNIPSNKVAQITWEGSDTTSCLECGFFWRVRPPRTTTYTITITDQRGCVASDHVTLSIFPDKRVYVPNAFSPNGDGNNDYFTVLSGPNVLIIESIEIYNRWGDYLYHAANVDPNQFGAGWDGKFHGKELDPGVYVYKIRVAFYDGEKIEFTGDVTLIR